MGKLEGVVSLENRRGENPEHNSGEPIQEGSTAHTWKKSATQAGRAKNQVEETDEKTIP